MRTFVLLIAFFLVLALFLVVYNARRRGKGSEGATDGDVGNSGVGNDVVVEGEAWDGWSEGNGVGSNGDDAGREVAEEDGCCGQHAVCEKTTLLNASLKTEYYDDEELDALAGRAAEDYSQEEYEMLRGVFETLREWDVAGWLRSIQLRGIELPEDIREQALFVVNEMRKGGG